MHEMAVLLTSEVGCRESNDPGSSVGNACEFGPVGDREHIEKARGAVHKVGLDNALKE